MNSKSLITGFFLVGLGLFLLANNFGYFFIDWYDFEYYWPLGLVAGGIFFWALWLADRKDYGLLMPGTILLVYGLLFWYNVQTNWWYMEELWPFFIIGPGLGFLAMYLFGGRDRGLLITGGILTGIGLVFLGGYYDFRYIWPVLLIAIGLRLLFKTRKQESNGTVS